MRILAIMSNTREENHSALVIRRIEAKLRKMDNQLEFLYVFLQNADVKICYGCKSCLSKEDANCPNDDDIPNIANSMLNADGMIFTSPSLAGNMSELMKNFMERVAFLWHEPGFFEKQGLFVTTPGSSGTISALVMTPISMGAWGFQTTAQAGTITHTADFRKIDQVASQFVNAIENNKIMSELPEPVTRQWSRRHYSNKGYYGGR
jgi:multimeric flavodoxin WrbA